jgi:hypothetical protein
MKAVIYRIISVLLGVTPAMQAQQQASGVSVKLNKADLRGSTLSLDLDMKLNYIALGRHESLSLTLVLKGTGKGQTLILPPVIINGTNKRQMFDRAVSIHGLTVAKKGAYAVLKTDPALIQYLSYKRAIAYKSWMSNCQLILVSEKKNYNNRTTQSSTNVLQKKIPVKRVATTAPAATNNNNRPATNNTNRPATNTNTNRPATNTNTNRPATNTNRPATNNRPANATNQPNTNTRPPANNNANRR